jgi:hypothetical protein
MKAVMYNCRLDLATAFRHQLMPDTPRETPEPLFRQKEQAYFPVQSVPHGRNSVIRNKAAMLRSIELIFQEAIAGWFGNHQLGF